MYHRIQAWFVAPHGVPTGAPEGTPPGLLVEPSPGVFSESGVIPGSVVHLPHLRKTATKALVGLVNPDLGKLPGWTAVSAKKWKATFEQVTGRPAVAREIPSNVKG